MALRTPQAAYRRICKILEQMPWYDWRPTPGVWGVAYRHALKRYTPHLFNAPRACPLGAVLLAADEPLAGVCHYADVAQLLRIEQHHVTAIALGYDTPEFATPPPNPDPWFEVGRKLRERYPACAE